MHLRVITTAEYRTHCWRSSKATKNMSRKTKHPHHKNKVMTNQSPADKLFDLIGHQIFQRNYNEAVDNCKRLLNYLPQHASLRADVLAQMGTALSMLQNYPQSYEALTEALTLAPNNADWWYNRGFASGFTMRTGEAVRDFERAAALNTEEGLTEKIDKALKFSREMAEKSLELRGPDFTLDQLIKQEYLFHQGMKLIEDDKWDEAAQAFQATIDMGDCLPQPWGNLATCWMMLERYDDAEVALRRALVIDPEYTIAKENLASLPTFRRNGPPQGVLINDPFKDSNIHKEITFIKQQ